MKIVDLVNSVSNLWCAARCDIRKDGKLVWCGNICQMPEEMQNMVFKKFYIRPEAIKFDQVRWIHFNL